MDYWVYLKKIPDNLLTVVGSPQIDKRATLVSYIVLSVFKHAFECDSYEKAILALGNL